MYGKATLATLVSKTSTNAAIETFAPINQGFTLGRQTTCSEGKVTAAELIASTPSLLRSCRAEADGHDFRQVPEQSSLARAERFLRSFPWHSPEAANQTVVPWPPQC